MDYDRIILEMLDRIKALEKEVAEIKGKTTVECTVKSDVAQMKASKKYRRLSELLDKSGSKTVSVTFEQIEKVIGFALPDSARKHRAFWANTTTHSIALSWLCVGYKTVEVNLNTQTVVFER